MPCPVEPLPLVLPAEELIPGANFAQEVRWAGVGNRVMSSPISAMMIAAAVGPIPGISSSRATASAKGARWSPIWGVDGGDVEIDGVDAGQHPGQQEPVMIIEGAQPKPSEGLL